MEYAVSKHKNGHEWINISIRDLTRQQAAQVMDLLHDLEETETATNGGVEHVAALGEQ